MAKKKAFALRLEADLLDAVEKWAADEFRSSNGQIEWIIHQALSKSGRLSKQAVERERQADEDEQT